MTWAPTRVVLGRSSSKTIGYLPTVRIPETGFGVFGGFGGFGGAGADYPGTGRPGSLQLDPLQDLAAAFRRGEISSYGDLLARSK